MKKLSALAITLAACLMLSACDNNINASSRQDISDKPDIEDILSDIAATQEKPDATDIDFNKPEIPQVEAISPSKLEYEFVTNGKNGSGIQINAINSAAEDIRFPDTIDGEPVVYISSKLEYSNNVKTLIFPDSVASCGFIPKSVEFVKLPESFDYETYIFPPFTDCKNLKEVWIPDGITAMHRQLTNHDGIFQGCTSLKSVCLPSGLLEIGSKLFSGCSSLERVYIPDSVTKIGDSAFKDCTSIISICIPDNVTSIDSCAFENCYNLKYIELPYSITSIASHTFFNCTSISSISIPDNVTSIDSCAFENCSNLTNIKIPDSVTNIAADAFNGCDKLETKASNGLNIINNQVVSCDKNITSVEIPSGVTGIGNNAFSGCSELTNIAIPDSVISIGDNAFKSCIKLTSITIPDSVTDIGDNAFENCSNLTNVSIGNGVTFIGQSTFIDCDKLTNIVLPKSITSIGDKAFNNCKSLKSITIPDSVKSIGEYAFFGCTSLESVIVPDSVTSIGNNAFANIMPYLIGMTLEEVNNRYGDIGFLKLVTEYEYDSGYSEGVIFEQDIAEGRIIENGTTVTVKISKGTQMVEVPDVSSTNKDIAIKTLESDGFKIKNIFEENADVAKDYVIRTIPEAHEMMPYGSTVTVVVSLGSPKKVVFINGQFVEQ